MVLPSSNTCFKQLILPNYDLKEVLKSKLQYSITEGNAGMDKDDHLN